MSTPQAQYLDVYRQGLEAAVTMARSALDEAERLRLKQVEAIRAALAENAELSRQIANATSAEELFAAQARFTSHQVEVAFGYWGKLFEAASNAQLEAIRRIDAQTVQFGERLAAFALNAPAGSEPLLGAMTSYLQAARTLYGFGAQASEQAVKLAEAQIETATAGIRDALAGAAKKTA